MSDEIPAITWLIREEVSERKKALRRQVDELISKDDWVAYKKWKNLENRKDEQRRRIDRFEKKYGKMSGKYKNVIKR